MYYVILFICTILSGTCGLILPTTKPDGSTDLTDILNHVTSLERSVTTLQTQTKQMESELQTTKTDLQATKTALQLSDSEITSLKAELQTVKGKLTTTSSELTSVKSELTTLGTEYNSLKDQLNLTLIDSISHDVKSNLADIRTLQADSHDMKQAVENTNVSAQACVTELAHLNDNVKRIVLEQNTTTTDISAMMSDISDLSNSVSVIQNMSFDSYGSLTQLSHELALKTEDISFHAYLTKSRDTEPNMPLKFGGIYHNAGNGYNTTTGKFIAPVSGTYLFSSQIEMHALGFSESTYLKIVQSGTTISESYGETSASANDDDITITVTAISYVGHGEEVWVSSLNHVSVFSTRFSASQFLGTLLAAS